MSLRVCESMLKTIDCEGRCHTVCYACGGPRCKGCSEIVTTEGLYKGKRVCVDCREDGVIHDYHDRKERAE